MPIFPHHVQSHILAEADNDRFQEGLGGGGCQEQSPPRNSSTSSPPAEQVAGLLQDLSKQPVKERVCLILEKGPAVLYDYF